MKSLKAKLLKFIPATLIIEKTEENPKPASLPDWYKDLPHHVNNSDKPISVKGIRDLKTCAPFRDALLAGYFITLPTDVEVIIENGEQNLYWNDFYPHQVIEKRGRVSDRRAQGYSMPVPLGCSDMMLAWRPLFGYETPKNYSVLVCHPLNRFDLPFQTTSGIIDSDMWTLSGNIPFFLKENFEGVIKKGTPIMQVIPIKRDSWQMKLMSNNKEANDIAMVKRDSYNGGYYLKFFRKQKSYK